MFLLIIVNLLCFDLYKEKKFVTVIRKRRKKEHLDGQSDYSGSLRFSEGTEDRVKDSRQISSESKDILNDQVTNAQRLFMHLKLFCSEIVFSNHCSMQWVWLGFP